jgi:hypothetical protein
MKTAKMYPGIDYGGGELAGYGQGGYDVSMDDPRIDPNYLEPQEQKTRLPSWMLPAGVVGGGLAAIAGVAALKRGKLPKKMPWNWDMEMLGRDGKKRFQSLVHPGETVGHGYGPGVEEVVSKVGSFEPARIIRGLGAIARR